MTLCHSLVVVVVVVHITERLSSRVWRVLLQHCCTLPGLRFRTTSAGNNNNYYYDYDDYYYYYYQRRCEFKMPKKTIAFFSTKVCCDFFDTGNTDAQNIIQSLP